MQEFYCPPKIVTGDGCAASLGAEAVALGRQARSCRHRQGPSGEDRCRHQRAGFTEGSRCGGRRLRWRRAGSARSDGEARALSSRAEFGPNLVVGLGGGSPLDIAKATAAILANEIPLESMWGVNNVPQRALPLILMSTTAGTGSEVTPNCILTDVKADGSHKKAGIVSPYILARTAIVDPLLTLTAPPGVTASTGMDALTHAIETYVSVNSQPLTMPLALEAIRLIGKYLRRAVANGSDVEARRNMANASMMAGLAFANGQLGAVHAIAMAMGGQFGVAHGIANALMLPYVMEFNEMAATAKFARIAQALGEPIDGLSERDAAHLAAEAVHQLIADIGLPEHPGRRQHLGRRHLPLWPRSLSAISACSKNNPRFATFKDIDRHHWSAPSTTDAIAARVGYWRPGSTH